MAGGIQKRNNRGGRFSRPVMSEINVTPLVDVMLVLLVIFMVTAPMMTVGVPVDLPKANASAINEQTEPLTISVTAKGEIYLQETPVPLEALVPRLQAITAAKPDTRIFVRGDQSIAYGKVMEVMGTLSAAGFNKVALLAELPTPSAQPTGSQPVTRPVKGR